MGLNFLKSRAALALTVALGLQAIVLYSYERREFVPPAPRLAEFPSQVGGWTLDSEGFMDDDVKRALEPDDFLMRTYQRGDVKAAAGLFIAYFQSQRTGKMPHSPKNCLPGSGWVASAAEEISLQLPGSGATAVVNRHVVSRGENRAIVYYWYQTPYRTIANEFAARYYALADAVRYNRTDTALVRVTVATTEDGEKEADELARGFIGEIYPRLSPYFPK